MPDSETNMISRRTVFGAGLAAAIAMPFISKRGLAQGCQAGSAFHACPSAAQSWIAYDESQPLAANCIEFDTTGCYVNASTVRVNGLLVTGYCFVPTCTVLARFFGQVLWHIPQDGDAVAAKLMMGELGTVAGLPGGEIAGEDTALFQSSASTVYNQTSRVQRTVIVRALTPVWFVPVYEGAPSGPPSLGNALGSGQTGMNTCNFFEGQILQVFP